MRFLWRKVSFFVENFSKSFSLKKLDWTWFMWEYTLVSCHMVAQRMIANEEISVLSVTIGTIHALVWSKSSQDFQNGAIDIFHLALARRNIHIKLKEWKNGEIFCTKENVKKFFTSFLKILKVLFIEKSSNFDIFLKEIIFS